MTDTEYKSWDEMTAEEQAEFHREMEQRRLWEDYKTYQEIVDTVTERYNVSWEEATKHVASYCYDLEEEAAEAAREERRDDFDPDEVADEVASMEVWEEKEESDEATE